MWLVHGKDFKISDGTAGILSEETAADALPIKAHLVSELKA